LNSRIAGAPVSRAATGNATETTAAAMKSLRAALGVLR
jgi:hypothetical protein